MASPTVLAQQIDGLTISAEASKNGHSLPFHRPVSKICPSHQLEPGCLLGPPRKPRQSGYGLWVGNLPITTDILKLKDHFASGATEDIESVFLISKSKCAFVNYRTERARLDAVKRFHTSEFSGVRLVCRVQRASSSSARPECSSSTINSRLPSPPCDDLDGKMQQIKRSSNPPDQDSVRTSPAISGKASHQSGKNANRFFIMKSLAVEDLLVSANDGLWATQSHNEAVLNEAYETSKHVYLIFSANRSGEYFGYALMRGRINKGSSIKEPKSYELVQPEVTLTPATQFAPRGSVVRDRHRDTIFWEATDITADAKDNDRSGVSASEGSNGSDSEKSTSDSGSQLSKPFKIEWISTNRVPFYMTTGLINQWNANRDVRWARDGTEVETSAGSRLLALFHQQQIPAVF
ncbi:hypothetical protein ACLMJK_006927 [Lecanora helva]